MRTSLIIGVTIALLAVLTGCGEKDVYDMMRENEMNKTAAEIEAELKAEEVAEQEREAEQKEKEEQIQWELENTDQIHYSINRYSENGKTIVGGKYTLIPVSSSKLETHKLKNRGYDRELDDQFLVVDRSFFGKSTPSGKFDIYYVVWEKGNRENAVRVGLGYRSISRGW